MFKVEEDCVQRQPFCRWSPPDSLVGTRETPAIFLGGSSGSGLGADHRVTLIWLLFWGAGGGGGVE